MHDNRGGGGIENSLAHCIIIINFYNVIHAIQQIKSEFTKGFIVKISVMHTQELIQIEMIEN